MPVGEKKYFYKWWFKIFRSLELGLYVSLLVYYLKNIDGRMDYLVLAMLSLLVYSGIMKVRSLLKPILIISDRGVFKHYELFNKYEDLGWDRISGYCYRCASRLFARKRIVLYYTTVLNYPQTEMVINYGLIRDGLNAVRLIEERIPAKQEKPANKMLLETKDGALPSKISYMGYKFMDEGIRKGGKTIPWSHVEDVYYSKDSVVGYGGLEIRYVDENGSSNILEVSSSETKRFVDVMRTVSAKAVNARVDREMYKALEYPLSEARRDLVSGLLTGIGMFAGIFALLFKGSTIENGNIWDWAAKVPFAALVLIGFVALPVNKSQHRVLIACAYLAIVILVIWKT